MLVCSLCIAEVFERFVTESTAKVVEEAEIAKTTLVAEKVLATKFYETTLTDMNAKMQNKAGPGAR